MSGARFAGKVVIVTAGGGTGTGGAVSRRFAEEGAKVVASDINVAGLELLVENSQPRDGGEILPWRADVMDPDEMAALVDFAVTQFGRLDVMVNHASGIRSNPDGPPRRRGPNFVHEMPIDLWHDSITGTLHSVFYGCRAALPHLLETKGNIVNTASISGMGGDFGMSPYDSAKAGVINLTRALAVDHGPQGVRVNCVSPGAIIHESTEPYFGPISAEYFDRVALKRFATPEDIAAGITFLASDDASYITGHNLVIDGGITGASGQFPFMRDR